MSINMKLEIDQSQNSPCQTPEPKRRYTRPFTVGLVLLVVSIPMSGLGVIGSLFGLAASPSLTKISLWSYGAAWALFLAGLALSGRQGYRLAKSWLNDLRKRLIGRRQWPSGFTLVELLIAAAVSAIILVVFAAVFANSLRSMGEVRDSAARWNDLERILALIAEDLEGAFVTIPPNPRYSFEIAGSELEGRPADRLSFTTATRGLVGADCGMVEVSYHLDEGHLYRREDATLDGTLDDEEGTELELGQDLLAFECSFMAPRSGMDTEEISDDWLEDWPPSRKGLPAIVRIALTALVGEEERTLSTAVALPLGEE